MSKKGISVSAGNSNLRIWGLIVSRSERLLLRLSRVSGAFVKQQQTRQPIYNIVLSCSDYNGVRESVRL
jgi:hypothetical protein